MKTMSMRFKNPTPCGAGLLKSCNRSFAAKRISLVDYGDWFSERRARGFTLLELLLAVGLVAVLAAFLFPAFQKVRLRAKDAQCVTNLRTWGLALMTYINEDKKGVYRNWYSGTRNDSADEQYWIWRVLYTASTKYSKDQVIRGRCPLAPGNDSSNGAVHYGFYAADSNGKLVDTPGGKAYELRVWTYPNPSKGVMLADSLNGSGEQAHTIFPATGLSRGAFHTRHDGKANVYFLDGHVEAATPKRLNELGVQKYYNSNGNERDTAGSP